MTKQLKNPPNCRESEMMVLGCMLTSIDGLKTASDMLNTDDFDFGDHKTIFKTLKNAHKNGQTVDLHLTAQELRRMEQLETVGGIGYLTKLAQFVGTSANTEEYGRILQKKAVLRKAIEAARDLERRALDNPENPFTVIEKTLRDLNTVNLRCSIESGSSLGSVISGSEARDKRDIVEKIRERHSYFKEHGKPFLTGIPTGFVDLDQKTTILEPMNLVVVAGRTAMGKTALALNIANNVCLQQGKPVGFISLEMSKEQLCERLLSMHTTIPGEALKRGTFDDRALPSIEKAATELSSAPFFIYDSHNSTIAHTVANSRRLKEKHDIQLLVIDYLQLLSVDGGADSRQYEVAEISRRLKMLARELQIPVIAIAQLSRKVEERTDKRPLMSDLRDSGQIEQDADVILFVHRRDYYDPKDKPGQADVMVKKNRNGDEAEISLSFEKGWGKFNNLQSVNNLKSKNIFG